MWFVIGLLIGSGIGFFAIGLISAARTMRFRATIREQEWEIHRLKTERSMRLWDGVYASAKAKCYDFPGVGSGDK